MKQIGGMGRVGQRRNTMMISPLNGLRNLSLALKEKGDADVQRRINDAELGQEVVYDENNNVIPKFKSPGTSPARIMQGTGLEAISDADSRSSEGICKAKHAKSPVEQKLKAEVKLKIKASKFVQSHKGKLRDVYRIGKLLGTGRRCEVRFCVHRQNGAQRACKVIKKDLLLAEERESILNEITILTVLDHPNIIKIYEFWEDEKRIFIVTEIVKGGQLMDLIVEKGKLSEEVTKSVLKYTLGCINYLHSQNIVHCDLKPTKLLMEASMEYDQIKVIDFGDAQKLNNEDHKLTEIRGEACYTAPEVYKGFYGKKCDIWSLGVLTHVCITGIPPFCGENEEIIKKKLEKKDISFNNPIWNAITDEGKDFVQKLLTKEEHLRPTASEALQHPWIMGLNKKYQDENMRGENATSALSNMASFEAHNKLKMATLSFIASQLLTKSEKAETDKVFRAMDRRNKGVLTKKDLQIGYLSYYGKIMTDKEIDTMFAAVDTDGSGEIEYSEFVVATLGEKVLFSGKKLQQAFQMFDKDDSGAISLEEIKDVLAVGEELDDKALQDIIEYVSEDKDEITYNEFLQIMGIDIAKLPIEQKPDVFKNFLQKQLKEKEEAKEKEEGLKQNSNQQLQTNSNPQLLQTKENGTQIEDVMAEAVPIVDMLKHKSSIAKKAVKL